MEVRKDIDIYLGDCLQLMREIPDKSIDMVLCDMPFGTTKNPWDSVIDLSSLWIHYKRVTKSGGAIVLFAQTPFDKVLGCSNLEMLKYEWIWEKSAATGCLNCNYAPMKCHENILVFSDKAAAPSKDHMVYYPQMRSGDPYKRPYGRTSTNYNGNQAEWSRVTVSNGSRYPRDVIQFVRDSEHLHPTQKPVDLLEYLIRTYTNKGDLVLDNCFGSGSTAIACLNTRRRFIGMELNEEYFNIAKDRIQNHLVPQTLF